MSPGGVANDSSVTLTLADTHGMLDGVTLNLNTQVNKKQTSISNQAYIRKVPFVQALSLSIMWSCNWFTIQLYLKRNIKRNGWCNLASVGTKLELMLFVSCLIRIICWSLGSDISCCAEWFRSVRTTNQLRPAGHTGQPPLPVHKRSLWQWIQCECVRLACAVHSYKVFRGIRSRLMNWEYAKVGNSLSNCDGFSVFLPNDFHMNMEKKLKALCNIQKAHSSTSKTLDFAAWLD